MGPIESTCRGQSEANLGLRLEVLAFDHEDTCFAGEIQARLATAGTPIGPYDSLIAG